MSFEDPFAAGKTNLRENVKMLATFFAGIAAVLLAGTPFSGFGGLPPWGYRFVIALGSLIVALASLAAALRFLLYLLRPDLVYPRWLRSTHLESNEKDESVRHEVEKLKASYKLYKDDLLPKGVVSFEMLEETIEDIWDIYKNSKLESDMKDWESYQDNLNMNICWASFTRLHQRISEGMNTIFFKGFIALIAIATFSWAVNPPKTDGIVVFRNVADIKTVSDVPHFEPVLFDLGKADMTTDGIETLHAARDYMRKHPNAGLLIYAHTDTLGNATVNRELAKRRAMSVTSLLVGEGGIAATRVFVSDLPQRDLPAITGPQVARDENRSVEFAIIRLPER